MSGNQISEIDAKPSPGGEARLLTELEVTGMTCANCARHVTQAIQGVNGVESVLVNLESNHATVRWSPGLREDIPTVLKAVEDEGFGARVMDAQSLEHATHKLAGWSLNLFVGVPITLVLVVGEWAFGLGMVRWFQWAAFALAGAVQVVAGGRFYRGAWSQLRAGNSNMDTLVSLGSTTAFGYSAWALLAGHGGHLYFMEAAAILTLISIGHWLESLVGARASSALRKLLDLAPATTRQRNADGTETEVPVAEIKAGVIVALRPGDRVPTDGEVIEGSSVVDESMLTGESVPVEKGAGSKVYAGTVNVNGRLAVEVSATGDRTALAHIIASVQRAQNSRANIQRLGDRVSSVFVPIVVAIAMAVALWWGLAHGSAEQAHRWLGQFLWAAEPPEGSLAAAFIIGSAVLIIACPCAMGLATPAAIMAGSNAAAQQGILVRDGVALEKAGQVTAVVFDKTGTLTTGKLSLASTWIAPAFSGFCDAELENSQGSPIPDRSQGSTEPRPTGSDDKVDKPGVTAVIARRGKTLAGLAAALAQHSTHPVSQALLKGVEPGIEFVDWQEIQGSGVQGKLKGRSAESDWVRLGSLRWLKENNVDLSAGQLFLAEWLAQGATIVGLSAGRRLEGLFAVKDVLKPGAGEVVRQLQHQGLKTYLVTGDNPLTAAAIGKQAGISAELIFAEIRPNKKAEFVKELQRKGESVAFVGDGINDAPALEQADLGIAVSRASDIAREAADIILLKSEIEAVPESLGLARATLRTIKQNLFWAFFYNAVGIPLAALGFMSPVLCAAAMGLSDMVVIGNALRLRRWRLRKS